MNDKRIRRTGGHKITQIDLNEYCKHNEHSGVGQGRVEVTDQGFFRDVLETEKRKSGLWQLVDKGKQD